MVKDLYFRDKKIKTILNEIHSLIYTDSENIESFKIKETSYEFMDTCDDDAEGWDEYRLGSLWGGLDKHFWFKAEILIPERFYGKTVALNITTGFEGEWDAINPQFLLYIDGRLIQGMDVNHREVVIAEKAEYGQKVRIALLAYSGMVDRMSNLYARIVVLDRKIEDLYYNINMPLSAAMLLDENDKRRIDTLNILDNAVNIIDLRKPLSPEFYRSIDESNIYLKEKFYSKKCCENVPKVTAIGHTHIDVAWLWTIAQTREKAARSFSTVINLMNQYPEYKFMSSQPQLYKFIKEDHPQLYSEIKKMVNEGRWEPEGAMWLESDCNITSGESLVRQILFGKRFFKSEFNIDSRVLWLPDVFGYSAALPQIMKKSGIKYFMTIKLGWNEYNQLPNDTFMWRGIDGTEILTHFVTTKDFSNKANEATTYVGDINPNQVMGAWDRYRNKDINDEVLMTFGYGDGGGGPTKEMLENARRLKYGVPGCPALNIDFAGNFFDRVYDKLKDSKRLPSWVGELYLEYHRGTYTSMARNKKYNRKSEFLYQDAEMLSSLALLTGAEYPEEQLNKGWETILLNQFHDILPGSAIKQVYEDSKAQYEEVLSDGKKIVWKAIDHITENINLQSKSLVVLNTLSHERNDIVEFEIPQGMEHVCIADDEEKFIPCQFIGGNKAIFYGTGIPPKGYKTYRIVDRLYKTDNDMRVSNYCMENKFFKIVFDEHCNIISLYDKLNDREVIKKGEKANVLQAFEDKPAEYDNWNVDIYYRDKMWEIDDLSDAEIVENGPVRCTLKVVRKFCDSTISQLISIYNDIPRIDFKTGIDWREKQILLKAAFPVDINSSRASYDIQYGNVERDTHWNTTWDAARFEVCAHKWGDLSENGYGVSLLNDCKYGYDIKDSVMRLTLLKSGIYPNPDADKEYHEFVYSIYPHKDGWRDAGTVRMAYNLNVPLYAKIEPAHSGVLPEKLSLASVNKDNIILEVVKKAEDSKDIILRLYECCNRRDNAELTFFKNIEEVWECDLMENKVNKINAYGNSFNFKIKPYEIKTFLLKVL